MISVVQKRLVMGGSDLGRSARREQEALDELRRQQGPHSFKPNFPVPGIPGWEWGRVNPGWRRWAQVANGDWYAFYCETGPNKSWHHENPEDPNWWYRYGFEGDITHLCCRHGGRAWEIASHPCPDPSGSCGDGPTPRKVYTEQEITDAMKLTAQLIQEVESL